MWILLLVQLILSLGQAWVTSLKLGQSALRHFQLPLVNSRWTAEFSSEYEVIGPFPQEAREQHFANPGFPLRSNISFPLDYTQRFPSHLADDGFVYWKNVSLSSLPDLLPPRLAHFTPSNLVHYSISFPNIRWDSIRATEGWAGLQHHALLHTRIRLAPPRIYDDSAGLIPTYLALSASQCSYVAILDPGLGGSHVPRWHACNIYAYSDIPAARVPVNFSESGTVELDVLISLDYEIRLFGDPTVSSKSTMPAIQAELSVEVETECSANLFGESTHPNESSLSMYPCLRAGSTKAHVFPHFIGGRAYGKIIGIEVSSCSQDDWTVKDAFISGTGRFLDFMPLTLVEPTRIAASQTRLVSFYLVQTDMLPSAVTSLSIGIRLYATSLDYSLQTHTIETTIPVTHHASLSNFTGDAHGALMTYRTVSGAPASVVVVPPNRDQQPVTSETRILLAMHGAGVMYTSPFWFSALPRPAHTWVLIVQGLTPWGLDWREASRADVCAALREFVLWLVGYWREDGYCTPHDWGQPGGPTGEPKLGSRVIPVIAIGHSNGGQGSLQLGSMFPDSIPALIPAAGYTSARLYISTQHSRGSLFGDANLQGLMRASLQGQDGDLVAGNLALSRVHLVHGGDDENVPVWHSRERMTLVKTWHPEANISMTEVSGKPHFWDTVFQDEPVLSRINELVASPYATPNRTTPEFTFTVVWPSESGSMHGWRVRELSIPGRISRVRVSGDTIRTTNTHGLSVRLSKAELNPGSTINIDGQTIAIPRIPYLWLRRDDDMQWKVVSPFNAYPSGPLTSILTSAKPIAIIIPNQPAEYYQSIALRIAHNLYTYLKLDCAILADDEVKTGTLKDRSVVVVGGRHNKYGLCVRRPSPLQVSPDGAIIISGREYSEPGTAAISLHQRHLFIDAVDESGYERVLRMFPLRTGVPGPEWMVVGEGCDQEGFGGTLAAGFWNRTGGLSESMTYFT